MTIAPDAEELVILTGGLRLGGWLSARVQRGIERLPSRFLVELTERYPGQAGTAVVDPGSTAQVFLGADLILTGYIDLYNPEYDGQQHVVRIEGRSKTEDLVDCSVAPPAVPPWSASGNFAAFATKLAKPFGISVVGGDVNLPSQSTFEINPGETCAQLLEDLARSVELLMYDDPQGRLVLAPVGTTRAGSPLVEGVNCEVAKARLSMDQRYSVIYVLSQAGIKAADTFHASYQETATDAGVRYRPLLVVMDMPGANNSWAKQRAIWEQNRRIARSQVVEVTVTGWRDGAGMLWTPNTIVKATLPTAKVNADMLIAACSWLRGPAGTQTTMTLMPPQGFAPEPYQNPGAVPGLVGPGSDGARGPGLG